MHAHKFQFNWDAHSISLLFVGHKITQAAAPEATKPLATINPLVAKNTSAKQPLLATTGPPSKATKVQITPPKSHSFFLPKAPQVQGPTIPKSSKPRFQWVPKSTVSP